METKDKVTNVKGSPLSEALTESIVKLTGAPFQWSIKFVAEGVIRAVNGAQVFEGSLEEFNRRLK